MTNILLFLNFVQFGLFAFVHPSSKPILKNDPIKEISFGNDPNVNYTFPTFTKDNKGQAVLYWTEKNASNEMALYFCTSNDGKTFGDKKLIYSDVNISSGKLMRPKLLFKKNGDIVAVFSYRTTGSTPPAAKAPVATGHDGHATGGHSDHAAPPPPPSGGRPKRSSDIRFIVSSDGGATWTQPTSVDTDATLLTRGFFDAVVMSNDEIAVTYLKDVKGSTKHEERDLRLAVTKNGVFQPERLIDAIVCDCCNITMYLDNEKNLHMIYRDNNDDIRDMAHIVSKDNGQSFSTPKILHDDKWQISGCPHSGAYAATTLSDQFITWYSGTQNGEQGFRLSNGKGDVMKILDDSAKNAAVGAEKDLAVWIWEQPANGSSSLVYSKIVNGKLQEPQEVAESNNGQNPSTLIYKGNIIVAYEEKVDKNTGLKIKVVN